MEGVHPVQTVSELMVTNLVTLTESASLADAKKIMQDKNIRNLPILDEQGQCIGMLTQREYLKHAFYLVSQFGTGMLSKKEAQTPVSKAMNSDMLTIEKDTHLDTAAEFFVENKYGCLPVVDQGKLVGILTPIDFVKLARSLLSEKQAN